MHCCWEACLTVVNSSPVTSKDHKFKESLGPIPISGPAVTYCECKSFPTQKQKKRGTWLYSTLFAIHDEQ